MATLHIRCGSDIREKLAEAGLGGDFLEYSDPVCQGPTPGGVSAREFRDARAGFLASDYGLPLAEARRRLEEEEDGLERASAYDRIFLWFEHDLYDQAVLARLLNHFADRPELRVHLRLVCVDGYPGVSRFRGLGDLSATQLASLAAAPIAVTAEMLEIGRRAWMTFTAADPVGLSELVRGGTPALPLLGPALRRHLQELPWMEDGLSRTERLTLEAFAAGCETPGRAFRHVEQAEAAPWLGDLMFWPISARLGRGSCPALTPYRAPRERVELTDTGRALLAGEADWVELNGIDRWVGGIRLQGRHASWRYSGRDGQPVASGKS